jgi:hypothetical protein
MKTQFNTVARKIEAIRQPQAQEKQNKFSEITREKRNERSNLLKVRMSNEELALAIFNFLFPSTK